MLTRWLRYFMFVFLVVLTALAALPAAATGLITIAAAADLKFAMDDIVTAFKQTHPTDTVQVVYGSLEARPTSRPSPKQRNA